MTKQTLPHCSVPECTNNIQVGWPGVGWVCGTCCIKLNQAKIDLENKKGKETLKRMLEVSRS